MTDDTNELPEEAQSLQEALEALMEDPKYKGKVTVLPPHKKP